MEAEGEEFEGLLHSCLNDVENIWMKSAYVLTKKLVVLSGCESELTLSTPDVCGLEKDRGEGRNFTTKWFFDMEYGGCSR